MVMVSIQSRVFVDQNSIFKGWHTAFFWLTSSCLVGWQQTKHILRLKVETSVYLVIYLSIYLSIVLYICIYIHHFCKIWNLYIYRYDYMHIHIYCVWINKYIYIYAFNYIHIYKYILIYEYTVHIYIYIYIYVYIWPHCAIGLHPCHDIPGSLPEVSAHAWPEFDLFPGDSGWRKLMKSGKEPKLWRDLWKRMYPLVI